MEDRFITLDEGLQAGTVEISEIGATTTARDQSRSVASDPFANAPDEDPFGVPAPEAPFQHAQAANRAASLNRPNSVNELVVVNRSDKPLYLMPGELIIGGDQDRTIGEELVIAPDGQPVSLNVFCVEHGRWGGRGEAVYASLLPLTPADQSGTSEAPEFGTSPALSEVAEEANSGKFVGSRGSLNKQARLAIQSGEGQGKVWESVASVNAQGGVETETGTFAQNYVDTASVERLEAYMAHLQSPIEEATNVVGVIVAVNGKIESLDIFESTPLFRKLWPKLLKSYALDASNAKADGQSASPAKREDAIGFLHDSAKAKAMKSDSEGGLARSRNESERVLVGQRHVRGSVGG